MLNLPATMSAKVANRVQAVLALLHGTPASQLTTAYGICRRDLYKFRRRALGALEQALQDQPRGSRQQPNTIPPDQTAAVRRLCERYSTWSSYRIHRRLGESAPSPRTIQRLRKRWGLPRVTKREPPRRAAIRLNQAEKQRVRHAISRYTYLGARRLAWDLNNRARFVVGHATITRYKQAMHAEQNPPPPRPQWRFYERHHPHSLWHGDFMEKVVLSESGKRAYHLALLDDYSRAYVFCDLTLNPTASFTIRALIAAMRQYQVLPKGVVFDNGGGFRGKLLTVFCRDLGIKLIHTTPYHPQTNGKLERSFYSDMRDFYKQYETWELERLRQDLPAYVEYRNTIRGHWALGGRPTITRLREQHRMALPWVLDQLESYAMYPMMQRTLPKQSCFGWFQRKVYFDPSWSGLEVTLWATLEGLEMRHQETRLGLWRDYHVYRQMWGRCEFDQLPEAFYFEPYQEQSCARNAVAYSQ